MSAFFSPAVTVSRTYSTDSHSRTSPAMMTSTLGSIFNAAWIAVVAGSSPTVWTVRRSSPTTRMPPRASSFFLTDNARAASVVAGMDTREGSVCDRNRDQPSASARPCANGSGVRRRQWSLKRQTTRRCLAMKSCLATKTGSGLGAGAAVPASSRRGWSGRAAGAASRRRRGAIGPRIERRLTRDDQVRAGLDGAVEDAQRGQVRHGDACHRGRWIAGLERVDGFRRSSRRRPVS